MLTPGIYEQVINEYVKGEISELPDSLILTEKIDESEAPEVLANYISEKIKKALIQISENEGLQEQVSLINKIAGIINTQVSDENIFVPDDAKQLLSVLSAEDPLVATGKKTTKNIVRPETSIAQSGLFTGSLCEPQMFSELKKEIVSADRIDMLVSFIKWSGLRLIIDELRTFTGNGGKLRVITTTYMGATEVKAISELSKLENTELKISYDSTRTRLHAKAYVFYRNTGFTTAYIGSSNLSNAAISSGLEWNVKATEKDMKQLLNKVDVTFESYWNSQEFLSYSNNDIDKLRKALKIQNSGIATENQEYIFDINPYPYQQEILDSVEADRIIRGSYKNLIVAATGTGKTLISAFDYRRFVQENPGKKNRLLFVAHREEILKQSLNVFRAVLKDANFGELFVGDNKPDNLDHLFVSIQTLTSQKLHRNLKPDYYDFIIVDEFHHAAAPTYEDVLTSFTPQILLGLTATPERMDGKNILDYFGGRISAEIRLPEAIDRKLLCPFQYFGVSDDVDLSEIKWTKGGYDKSELSNIYSVNRVVAERRANSIINSVNKYVSDINNVHGIGFCVSVKHAQFMAEYFNSKGIPSISLESSSDDELRKTAKKKLVSGEIKFIFVVDLYNEGVDIPEIDTVLFLRPTESLTVFLQQLGRGLRLSDGKECLTVLDFIGQANKKYNFEEKFAALLANSSYSVSYEIKKGFVALPKGCYIQLEKKATEIILENIRKAFGDKNALVKKLSTFEEDSGLKVNLGNFVSYYNLPINAIYKNYSFTRLCIEAGVISEINEPLERDLQNTLKRFVAIDSRRWIKFLVDNLSGISIEKIKNMSLIEKRMMQMFYTSIWNKAAEWDSAETKDNIEKLKNSPVFVEEIIQILKYNLNRIDFVDSDSGLGFDCPLDVHCTYTRDQLLVAIDYMTPSNVREGVKYLPEIKTDIFFVTLNKSDKDYSPTTMYNDYSINELFFHTQSQSTTSDTSPTGKRYISSNGRDNHVLLFVRENKKNEMGTSPYTFLGQVKYVSHNGSRPMNIVWKMDKPIPAKYLKKTNKLVVG